MRSEIKVGFLCEHDPFDRQAFSGTAYFAYKALQTAPGLDVTVLGTHRPMGALRRRLSRVIAFQEARKPVVIPDSLDVVVSMVATSLINEVLGATNVPIVHMTDATPGFLREYYRAQLPDSADAQEIRALAGAALTIYSSDFMAERARAEFGADVASRLAVVPFGVNMEQLPDILPDKARLDPVRLLYIGTDWVRKGGELALQTQQALRAQGVNAQLSLVGAVPAAVARAEGVEVVGYLNKNTARGAAQLEQLLRDAHVFILPTRADCTPMVVAEANAYGTPVAITETGGIGTLMRDGANGHMMSMSAGPADWAHTIAGMVSDRDRYQRLSEQSFLHARNHLSWSVWSQKVTDLLTDIVAAPAPIRAQGGIG